MWLIQIIKPSQILIRLLNQQKLKFQRARFLEGAELKNGEFNFQLLDETGKVLQTKQNAADGTVTFDDISYSSEDAGKTFHYTIKEVIPESKAKE